MNELKVYKFFSEELSPIKGIFLSLFLSFLFVFPLLHSNIYYEDDLFRIFTGQYVWEMLGRIFTFWLMHIVSFSGNTMLNVTPLPLLLSFIVITHMIFYVAKNVLESLTIVNILIAFCFVCNPYLLANLSYAYDCLHMILGFYFSIIAYVKITEGKRTSVLWLLSAFLFYQSMGNIFLSLSFFSIIKSLTQGGGIKRSLILFCKVLVTYVIAILLYLLFLKVFYLITNHIFQRSEQLSIFELINGIFFERIENLIKYIQVLYENQESKFLLWVLCLFSLASIFFLKNITKITLVVLSILGAFFAIFGPMYLLKEGLITARVLTPLGTLLFILLYLSYNTSIKNVRFIRYFPLLIICAFSWYHITLSFGYGNYLSLQRKYDEKLLTMVQMDVLSLQDKDEKIMNRWVHLEGCSQEPRSVKLLGDLRPFYRQLHNKACTWRARFIMFDEMLGNFKMDRRWNATYPEITKKICNENVLPSISRGLYSIYTHKDFVFIKLGSKIKCN